MTCLHYQDDTLFIESISLNEIAALFGTPCYVYSQSQLLTNWQSFKKALSPIPHQLCYAVKANSNLAILRLLAKQNAGFDIVSMGEAIRVITAGGKPEKIVFSGIGKSAIEIEQAIDSHIHCFNVESVVELKRIRDIATTQKKQVNIALRVNPNINPNTHIFISTGLDTNKFGMPQNEIVPLAKKIVHDPFIKLIGLSSHIGSQITSLSPFLALVDALLKIFYELKQAGITLSHLNLGGGLGIPYHTEQPPSINAYTEAILQQLPKENIEWVFEPGRAVVGNAGVLLTRVEYLKHTSHKNFAVVDAGMTDLLRPALYDAWHTILPANRHSIQPLTYDIVGPVCESSDILGKDRQLALLENDLLVIDTAGAYGFSMSSNYNARCRPAEVLVSQDKAILIRRRETVEELMQNEIV